MRKSGDLGIVGPVEVVFFSVFVLVGQLHRGKLAAILDSGGLAVQRRQTALTTTTVSSDLTHYACVGTIGGGRR